MTGSAADEPFLADLWSLVDGDPHTLDAVSMTGALQVLPSVYDVTGWAGATVAAASLAAAELGAVRAGGPVPAVDVDRVDASAAFVAEALFTPDGWERPPIWDPIAGDYRTADGWIRLHTNYAHHRDAALSVLGTPAARPDVTRAVAQWTRTALERSVVDAGGCAAAMHTRSEWHDHEHGRIAVHQPAVSMTAAGPATARHDVRGPADPTRPLAGVRVLDLTRVIAGPECTRFLAAWGADVLRIDPPGFEEVPSLLPETTAGKRCASLDLASPEGRRRFHDLLGEADVLVHGLRPGALEAMDLGGDRLRAANPALVVARLDAYGWAGPWAGRRGFDSLVQMSTGIASRGGEHAGVDRPVPLPAQALDHGIGFLLAAATCRALTVLLRDGRATDVHASLVGAANVLTARESGDPAAPSPRWPPAVLEHVVTAWGPARRVRCPGTIGGVRGTWSRPPGPLGRDTASFG